MIKKSLKPIDIDIHFKYNCDKCGATHWLSYNEVRSPKFKVVCDCGESFGIRRIDTVKCKFVKKQQSIKHKTTSVDSCAKYVKLLESYGLDRVSAQAIVEKTYSQYSSEDHSTFVKKLLEHIRG